ncbi:MAG TPA: prolyl oligopeptidase family serine peptidase [Patescibacteria group bacterium]|nr:prolyl oligopeptidase family serine peptidase [Patescibacteria group bacterium]
MNEREKLVEFPSPQLLRINGIAGMHYRTNISPRALLIYGIGAPILPDNGNLPDAPNILERGVDVFVPDYIGYGRSDGNFTPQNCINTFVELYENFKQGCTGRNYYEGVSTKLKYERIIFIGRSFGGTYVPLLPRFNSEIKELALFYPVVDSKHCGVVAGEETNERFLGSMKEDGYHYLYRGILDLMWKAHLENEDDLSPMDNMEYLKEAKLFIAHGMKDACVDYSHSVEYFNQLLERYPDKKDQIKLNLYPEGKHDKSTSNLAISDFLDWLGK